MDYDKMTIKSLANDCFEDSFYKINAADLESRIQYLCDKYHQDKLDNLSQHLVSGCLICIMDNVEGDGLTKGMRYKILAEKDDMYFIIDDNNNLGVYGEIFFDKE